MNDYPNNGKEPEMAKPQAVSLLAALGASPLQAAMPAQSALDELHGALARVHAKSEYRPLLRQLFQGEISLEQYRTRFGEMLNAQGAN